MKKTVIKVEGMHCRSCEALPKDGLEEAKGVRKAQASHMSGMVAVEYDENDIGLDAIRAMIRKEGYRAV